MLFIVGGLHGTQGTILGLLNTMGSKSIEQFRRDYLIPAFRQLDIDVVRGELLGVQRSITQDIYGRKLSGHDRVLWALALSNPGSVDLDYCSTSKS